MRKNLVTLSLFILAALPLRAQAITFDTYSVIPGNSGESGVSFSIGYTFGVHVGRSSQASGTVQATLDPLVLGSGELVVPIAAMTTGDPTRDCHMRESLGIDYTRSRFPNEHVCVSNQTPATGPDSVVFPTIGIKLVDVKSLDANIPPNALRLVRGQATEAQASLNLSIHGITQRVVTPIKLTVDAVGRVLVQAQVVVKLADYGIIVKSAGPVRVKDFATVTLNLLLAKPVK